REIEAVDAWNVTQLATRRISLARFLDFDNIGAKPRQNLCTGRSRLDMCHVQDPNTFQSLSHVFPSFQKLDWRMIPKSVLNSTLSLAFLRTPWPEHPRGAAGDLCLNSFFRLVILRSDTHTFVVDKG